MNLKQINCPFQWVSEWAHNLCQKVGLVGLQLEKAAVSIKLAINSIIIFASLLDQRLCSLMMYEENQFQLSYLPPCLRSTIINSLIQSCRDGWLPPPLAHSHVCAKNKVINLLRKFCTRQQQQTYHNTKVHCCLSDGKRCIKLCCAHIWHSERAEKIVRASTYGHLFDYW